MIWRAFLQVVVEWNYYLFCSNTFREGLKSMLTISWKLDDYAIINIMSDRQIAKAK